MAIKFYSTDTPGAIPSILEPRSLAFNIADRKMFIGNIEGDAVIDMTPTLTGDMVIYDDTLYNIGLVNLQDTTDETFRQIKLKFQANIDSKLNPTLGNPSDDDSYGYSIATNSTNLYIGSMGNDNLTSNGGVLYIYDLDGSNEAMLTASDDHASAYFGVSVAASETHIIVGAPNHDTLGDNRRGKAYIFDKNGGNEIQIIDPSGTIDDYFGSEVAINDTYVLVGSMEVGSYQGRVSQYLLDGTYVRSFDGISSNDSFGTSIAMTETQIVIGASGVYNNGNTSAGSVYVYGVDGVLQFELTATNTKDYLSFGKAVAITDTHILVGSSDHEAGGNGRVYLYNILGELVFERRPDVLIDSSYFGTRVELTNDIIVVGASPAYSQTGVVYFYDINGNNEVFVEGESSWDEFSIGISIQDDFIFVGAPSGNNNQIGYVKKFIAKSTSLQQDGAISISNAYSDDNLIEAKLYADLVTGDEIEEAPQDDLQYARRNADWIHLEEIAVTKHTSLGVVFSPLVRGASTTINFSDWRYIDNSILRGTLSPIQPLKTGYHYTNNYTKLVYYKPNTDEIIQIPGGFPGYTQSETTAAGANITSDDRIFCIRKGCDINGTSGSIWEISLDGIYTQIADLGYFSRPYTAGVYVGDYDNNGMITFVMDLRAYVLDTSDMSYTSTTFTIPSSHFIGADQDYYYSNEFHSTTNRIDKIDKISGAVVDSLNLFPEFGSSSDISIKVGLTVLYEPIEIEPSTSAVVEVPIPVTRP